MSLLYVTPNFSWAEFECSDGSAVPEAYKPNVRRLCQEVLEPLREALGAPLVIVSGYRSPVYNRRIGGAKLSQHVKGTAADVRPADMSLLSRLVQITEAKLAEGSLPALGGFGTYSRWIHVDVRHKPVDGRVARWTGNRQGSEQ